MIYKIALEYWVIPVSILTLALKLEDWVIPVSTLKKMYPVWMLASIRVSFLYPYQWTPVERWQAWRIVLQL